MIKDGGLSFQTHLKIEFLPPNNSSKKCLEKFLLLIKKGNKQTINNYQPVSLLPVCVKIFERLIFSS